MGLPKGSVKPNIFTDFALGDFVLVANICKAVCLPLTIGPLSRLSHGGMAELGRRRGLKIPYRKMYGFDSRSRHQYGASTVRIRNQLITGASPSREVRVLDAPPFSY